MAPDTAVRLGEGSESVVSTQLLLTNVEAFSRAARQASQYPVDHPIAQAATERARDALMELTARNGGPVQLTTYLRELHVSGVPLSTSPPGVDWLNSRLRRRLIKSVSIAPGLQDADVWALIQALVSEPELGTSRPDADDWLAQGGSGAIRVEEQDYSRILRASEAALLRLSSGNADGPLRDLIDLCTGALKSGHGEAARPATPDASAGVPGSARAGVLAALSPSSAAGPGSPVVRLGPADLAPPRAVTEQEMLAAGAAGLLQAGYERSCDDCELRERWLAEALRLMQELDPALRGAIFRAGTTVAEGGDDVLAVFATRLSVEQVLTDIVFTETGAIVREQSVAIEWLLRRIMPTHERLKQVEPALRSACLERGFSDENYRNIIGILVDRLLRDIVVSETQSGLCLYGHVGETHTSREAFQDLIATVQVDAVERSRARMLLELLRLADSFTLSEYSTICSDVVSRLDGSLRSQSATSAQELLDALASLAEGHAVASRRLVAASALGKLASLDLAVWVADRLHSAAPGEARRLADLLVLLGAPAGESVRSLMLDRESESAARAVTDALCRVGIAQLGSGIYDMTAGADHTSECPKAALRVIESLREGPVVGAMRLLQLLFANPRDEALRIAEAACSHPAQTVRLMLARLLGETQLPSAGRPLLRLIDDRSCEVRLESVRALARLGSPLPGREAEAVAKLVKAAQAPGRGGCARELRHEIVGLLGRLAHPAATEFLVSLLTRHGWSLTGDRDALASAAVEALTFIPGHSAEAALLDGRRSSRAGVAAACQAAVTARRRQFADDQPPDHETVTTGDSRDRMA